MQEVLTAISSYGFPIVACLLMAWYVKYTNDKHSIELQRMNDNHTKEMLAYKDELKTAINNNTLVMQKFCDMFGGGALHNEIE